MAQKKRQSSRAGGQGPVVIGDDGGLLGAHHLAIEDQAKPERLGDLDAGNPVTLTNTTIQNLKVTEAASGLNASFVGVSRIEVNDSNERFGITVDAISGDVVITNVVITGVKPKTKNVAGKHVSPNSGPVASLTIYYGANVATLPGSWGVQFDV